MCPGAAPLSGDSLYLVQASSFALNMFHSSTAWHGRPQGGGLQAGPTFCQPVLLPRVRLGGSVRYRVSLLLVRMLQKRVFLWEQVLELEGFQSHSEEDRFSEFTKCTQGHRAEGHWPLGYGRF